jgi:hypothetical protein
MRRRHWTSAGLLLTVWLCGPGQSWAMQDNLADPDHAQATLFASPGDAPPDQIAGWRLPLDWFKLADLWLDQANSAVWQILHDRFHWRDEIGKHISLHDLSIQGGIQDRLDSRYADSASLASGAQMFTPGMPRTLFLRIEANW